MNSANRSPPPSATKEKEKEKRVSRACISCRQRKTRCDLYSHGTPGEPPCTRCLQERLECTLATSRRGGRRPRKRLLDAGVEGSLPRQSIGNIQDSAEPTSPLVQRQSLPTHPMHAKNSITPTGTNTTTATNNNSEQPPPSSPGGTGTGTGPTTATNSRNGSRRPSVRIGVNAADIDGDFASRDLLNPSDALNLLAQVADLDGENNNNHSNLASGGGDTRAGADAHMSNRPADRMDGVAMDGRMSLDRGVGGQARHNSTAQAPFIYPPITDGHLSVADASYLLSHYHEHYHPFFPVADKRIFDGRDIPSLAQAEPHLLTSIFTVASKDDPAWHRVHEACANHMDTLVSHLISRGSSCVGAVEALLILAEWVPQRKDNEPSPGSGTGPASANFEKGANIIGRGEEDQGAWMQIGVAIRLAYLQGLEQTGLMLQEKDKSKERSLDFERKRIAWAACYMSDREVSIRLGKGFWSRGPGPSTVLNAGDFPTLRTQAAGSGDLAQLFQARLEMTQLFSNAHDILYSSTTHREQLFVGGEYVRYIDDFSAVLRKWKLVWGGLSLTPSVKAALILSYEFLRLYINAFAFQATISRAISRARQSPPQSRSAVRPLFADLAGTPDARFIYESIDAANTLLSTLNDFIDPASALRYMPLKYFLYVIYAAVFLFKARVAGALAGDSSSSARRTINVTIERLQKSSVNPHSLGQRYARSLYLLWRKSTAAGQSKSSHSRTGGHANNGGANNSNNNNGNNSQNMASSNADQGDTSMAGNGNGSGNDNGGANMADNAMASTASAQPVSSASAAAAELSSIPQHMHPGATPMGGQPGTPSTMPGGVFNAGHPGSASAAMGVGMGMGGMSMHGRPSTNELDPLKNFSWRDLDGLGQFIGNDMNFLDITFATPMSDSDHGMTGLDTMTDAWQDIVWSGNDVIF